MDADRDEETGRAGEALLSPDAGPEAFRVEGSRPLLLGGLVIAAIVLAAVLVPTLAVQNKERQFLAEARNRAEILAAGRVEVVETWLEGVVGIAERVVGSELFRLFATEAAIARGETGDKGLSESLRQQIPYMNQILTDFASNSDFLSVRMLGPDGDSYVQSANAAPLGPERRGQAARAITEAEPVSGPASATVEGLLVLDLYLPVFPPQAEPGDSEAVAALALRVPLDARASAFVAPPALAQPGERFRLLQKTGEAWQEIAPGGSPQVRAVAPIAGLSRGDGLPFARRAAIGGGPEVYSAGRPVPALGWVIVHEIEADLARAGVRDFTIAAITLAVVVVLGVVAVFGAFWWRMVGEHNKALAHQFQRLAARIFSQKQLLDGITDTIKEHLGLKDREGRYTYVNPAFAEAVGRPRDKIIGLDDRALFGQGSAQRLRAADEQALAEGGPVTTAEQIYLGTRMRHLQISKVPLRDREGDVTGIVSVARDVTELVEAQERRERAIKQTVNALVEAIELRDPYLAGHSRRVAGFAVEVARRLSASRQEIDTLEAAANLSQIGKLALPRSLLNKPDRLGPEEIAEMQRHVEHAARILRDIDFGLPVRDAVLQMHERLDGGGYPKGLKGEEIGLTGRILGICDVFCARIAPRSYRAAISAEEALSILEGLPERYDARVVVALREVVNSPAGEKLIAGIGR